MSVSGFIVCTYVQWQDLPICKFYKAGKFVRCRNCIPPKFAQCRVVILTIPCVRPDFD